MKRRDFFSRLGRVFASGYGNHGANRTKKGLVGWISVGGSPKEDIEDNLPLLRERSRDLYMGGAAMATGALKTMRTNVVGAGLKVKPRLDEKALGMSPEKARALEREMEEEFLLWSTSKDCDALRMNTFYELQQLVFLSQLMSGEVFVLLPMIDRGGPYQLALQVLEADYVGGELLDEDGGIVRGCFGEPVAYYVYESHPKGKMVAPKRRKIPAYDKTGCPNILHVMEAERPGQLRGVPLLASVIEPLKQLGRYTEAELMAAVVNAMFTVFIERSPEANLDPVEPLFGESIADEARVDADENAIELGYGSIVGLEPGETIREATTNRPNANFDGFVLAMSRQIGAALEIPQELLLKQFTSSYSASRAALLEAWKMFRMKREALVSDFCAPVYEAWMCEAVGRGRIDAPGFFTDPRRRKNYLRCEWAGPTPGQIDPLKEVNAAARRVEEGFSTRSRETIELTGGNYEANARALIVEESLRGKERDDEENLSEGARG